jgi:methylglyoxal reductase
MQYRKLGQTGIEISAVGLGTWAIGGGPWWGDSDDALSVRTIHAALDSGINLIDTAPVYGFGRSEKVVGEALFGRRDRAVLATKCGLWWASDTGSPHFELSGVKVRVSLSPQTIRQEVEASLLRLRTDRIDLMQTHWQAAEPFKTPIADTMACLMDLRDEGKIRAIGVSNATCEQMDEYREAGALAVCQPRYSMLDRRIEADLLPYCRAHDIAVLAYSPLEQGLLTGKIGMDRQLSATESRNRIVWFKPENRRLVLELLAGWQDLQMKHRCSLSELVIAWTVAQPGLTCALCGARRPENAAENAGGGGLTLDTADLLRMRQDAERLVPVA